jgi:hypothetical protein
LTSNKQWANKVRGVFFAVLWCFSSLLSAQNSQKIVPIDSEIYQAIKSLYISQGLALPSTAGPWSQAELLLLLDRIDTSRLQGAALQTYDFASEQLKEKPRPFKFSGALNVEVYAHTDAEHFLTQDFYIRDWGEAKPLLELDFESWIGKHFYGFGSIDIANSIYNTTIDSPYTNFGTDTTNATAIVSSTQFGATQWSTNTIIAKFPTLELDFSIPYRSVFAAGGDHFSIAIGRDKLSWGAGESGNFMLGSQVDYHTGLRAAFFDKAFKYTYAVSSFSHPSEYYNNDKKLFDPSIGYGTGYQPATGYFTDWTRGGYGGIQLFIAHRFEGRLFKDKLGLALSEAIIYQNKDGYLAPEVLIPLILLHNLNRADNSNSLLTIEADISPIPMLNIYGQLAVDEFAVLSEGVPGVDADPQPPNAFAYMLGAKTAFPLWIGMFNASAEFALTDPYLYLRYDYARSTLGEASSGDGQQKLGQNPLNFVVANRYREPSDTYFWEEFLGYRWGGDALVFNVNTSLQVFGSWSVGLNFFFMRHGANDKWTLYDSITREDYDSASAEYNPIQQTPTEAHYSENNADNSARDYRNAAYNLSALSLYGQYTLGFISFYGQGDLIIITNPGNHKGNGTINDFQLTVGVSLNF